MSSQSTGRASQRIEDAPTTTTTAGATSSAASFSAELLHAKSSFSSASSSSCHSRINNISDRDSGQCSIEEVINSFLPELNNTHKHGATTTAILPTFNLGLDYQSDSTQYKALGDTELSALSRLPPATINNKTNNNDTRKARSYDDEENEKNNNSSSNNDIRECNFETSRSLNSMGQRRIQLWPGSSMTNVGLGPRGRSFDSYARFRRSTGGQSNNAVAAPPDATPSSNLPFFDRALMEVDSFLLTTNPFGGCVCVYDTLPVPSTAVTKVRLRSSDSIPSNSASFGGYFLESDSEDTRSSLTSNKRLLEYRNSALIPTSVVPTASAAIHLSTSMDTYTSASSARTRLIQIQHSNSDVEFGGANDINGIRTSALSEPTTAPLEYHTDITTSNKESLLIPDSTNPHHDLSVPYSIVTNKRSSTKSKSKKKKIQKVWKRTQKILAQTPVGYHLLTMERRRLKTAILFVMLPVWMAIWSAAYSHIEGWNAIESIYFIVQTFTTVGFGDVQPRTNLGLSVFPIASMGGITLLATCVAHVAVYMSTTMSWVKIKNVVLFFIVVQILASLLFMYLEHWTWGQSLYFLYNCASTTGLSEEVPKSNMGRIAFCFLMLIVFSIFTTMIKLMVDNVMKGSYAEAVDEKDMTRSQFNKVLRRSFTDNMV